MLRTVVHYIMTMKTCHISEVAKEKMTDRQLGDLGKIDCGQPLKIPGGKNMACRQLWGAAQHVSGSKTSLLVTSWSEGEGHVRGGGQHHPQEELLPLRCHQLSDTGLKSTGQEDFIFCNSRKWRPWGYRKYFADSQHCEGSSYIVLIGARQQRDQAVINCNAFSTEMIFFEDGDSYLWSLHYY